MRRNGTVLEKLSARQLTMVELLIAGQPVQRAARIVGVGRTTAFRWLRDPDFKTAMAGAKATIFNRAIMELKTATLSAGRKLIGLIGSKSENTARLAATTILEVGFRIKEEEEIDRRLTALEKIVKQNSGAGGDIE